MDSGDAGGFQCPNDVAAEIELAMSGTAAVLEEPRVVRIPVEKGRGKFGPDFIR